ncbi:MAG: hypothetical protein IT384_25220 [Deltaproteobacteria bacterium]|nr:hypothetical protein [Deltaproteobacteria bacterium]
MTGRSGSVDRPPPESAPAIGASLVSRGELGYCGSRLRRLCTALAAASLAACSSGPDLRLIAADPPEIDLFVVVGSRSGEPTSARLVSRSDAGTVELTGDRATVFGISSSDLVEPSGVALSTSALAELSAGLETDTAPASCGRCLFPVSRPPWVLHPGTACAPPRFAPVWSGEVGGKEMLEADDPQGTEVAQIRERVRLLRGGPCAHPIAELGAPAALPDLEEIFPAPDGWGADAVAATPGGALALFAGARVIEVASDGRRAVLTVQPRRIIDAVGLGDGSFLVIRAETPALLDGGRIERYRAGVFEPVSTPALRSAHDLELVPAALAPALDDRPAPAGLVLVAAALDSDAIGQTEPGLLACAVGERVECLPIAVDTWTFGPSALTRLLLLSDGTVIAAMRERPTDRLLYGARRDDRWHFVIGEELAPAWTISAARAIGQAALACTIQDDRGGVVMTTTLSADTVVRGAAPRWSEIPALWSGCTSITPVPGQPDHAWLTYGYPHFHLNEVDLASGSALDPRTVHDVFGIPFVREVAPVGVDGLLVVSDLGVYKSVRADRDAVELAQVYGPPATTELMGTVGAIAATRAGFAAFSASARFDVALGPATAVRVSTVSLTPYGSPIAALETEDGSILVAGPDLTAQQGHLWRARGAELVDLAPESDLSIYDLAPLTAETQIAVGEDWKLWSIDGDRVTPIEVDWDDPTTPEPEGPPRLERPANLFGCPLEPGATNFAGGQGPSWRDVDAAGGVAWVAGCSGALARVVPGAPAERFDASRLVTTLAAGRDLVAPDFTAVRVLAPDHVLLTSVGREPSRRSGRLFEVRSRGSELTLEERVVPDLGGYTEPTWWLLGSSEALYEVTIDALRSEGGVTFLPMPGRAMARTAYSAAEREGAVLVGGSGPQLFLFR